MLEAKLHSDNCFATLTYSDENLPENKSLKPDDLKLFLYRLRQAMKPHKIRFFACGEYGDETERPHYHLAIFNFPSCRNGFTNRRGASFCCAQCATIQKLWPLGHIFLGTLEQNSANYIAGYVTKKLTDGRDARLNGRHPEFTRQSNRPGIGADAMDEVASVLMELGLDAAPDVPAALTHGRSTWPLGRYLRRRLRTRIGRSPDAPKETIQQMEEKLRPVREAAHAMAPKGQRQTQFKNLLIELNEGKHINQEARHNRYKKKGNL